MVSLKGAGTQDSIKQTCVECFQRERDKKAVGPTNYEPLCLTRPSSQLVSLWPTHDSVKGRHVRQAGGRARTHAHKRAESGMKRSDASSGQSRGCRQRLWSRRPTEDMMENLVA